MKATYLLIALGLAACTESSPPPAGHNHPDTVVVPTDTSPVASDSGTDGPPAPKKVYANERFRDVTVQPAGKDRYTVRGKGQIFEANFGWVVEDGHRELQQGHQMTDAGAPEWGSFEFTVEVTKQRPNSTLTLVLFESSPKDGNRTYELPVVLAP